MEEEPGEKRWLKVTQWPGSESITCHLLDVYFLNSAVSKNNTSHLWQNSNLYEPPIQLLIFL